MATDLSNEPDPLIAVLQTNLGGKKKGIDGMAKKGRFQLALEKLEMHPSGGVVKKKVQSLAEDGKDGAIVEELPVKVTPGKPFPTEKKENRNKVVVGNGIGSEVGEIPQGKALFFEGFRLLEDL
jgi:hypothetical protein